MPLGPHGGFSGGRRKHSRPVLRVPTPLGQHPLGAGQQAGLMVTGSVCVAGGWVDDCIRGLGVRSHTDLI